MSIAAMMMLLLDTRAVHVGSHSHTRISSPPAQAHAGFRLNSNGSMQGTSATNLNWALNDGTWLFVGENSNYEVRFTKDSGDDPAGTLNTWMALSTTRAISYSQLGIGELTGVFTVEIRLASTEVILTSGSVSLAAVVAG